MYIFRIPTCFFGVLSLNLHLLSCEKLCMCIFFFFGGGFFAVLLYIYLNFLLINFQRGNFSPINTRDGPDMGRIFGQIRTFMFGWITVIFTNIRPNAGYLDKNAAEFRIFGQICGRIPDFGQICGRIPVFWTNMRPKIRNKAFYQPDIWSI